MNETPEQLRNSAENIFREALSLIKNDQYNEALNVLKMAEEVALIPHSADSLMKNNIFAAIVFCFYNINLKNYFGSSS
jgi:hypothetical protein